MERFASKIMESPWKHRWINVWRDLPVREEFEVYLKIRRLLGEE